MSDNTEEYERYSRIAHEKKTTKAGKSKTEVWQLVFGPAKERIVHGAYSLCQSFKNKYKNDKRYRIIPFTN